MLNRQPIEIIVPGKWVLAGEHTVLRGGSAVALPHPEYRLSLKFEESRDAGGFEVFPPEQRELFRMLFAAIPGAADRVGSLRGTLSISSSIPPGAGLGSSAAICVALTRLAHDWGLVSDEEILATATRLEDHFHGQSSGMDVAVISEGLPLLYRRGGVPVRIQIRKMPKFTFHDTGSRAATRTCIEAVEALRGRSPEIAAAADEKMKAAAGESMTGLIKYDSGDLEMGLLHLTKAIELGQQAFEGWGLVPPAAAEIAESLRTQGALAVKLTGAGNGGFLVALWR